MSIDVDPSPDPPVAPFSILIPVVGIAAAWIALGEISGPTEILGAAVVVSGLLLINRA